MHMGGPQASSAFLLAAFASAVATVAASLDGSASMPSRTTAACLRRGRSEASLTNHPSLAAHHVAVMSFHAVCLPRSGVFLPSPSPSSSSEATKRCPHLLTSLMISEAAEARESPTLPSCEVMIFHFTKRTKRIRREGMEGPLPDDCWEGRDWGREQAKGGGESAEGFGGGGEGGGS